MSTWSKIYRTYPIDGIVYPDAFRKTADNGFIVVGHTINTYLTGNGDEDAQAVKITSDGKIVWAKTYGDTGREHFYSVLTTTDGYIVGGATNSGGADPFNDPYDAWIVKLSADGTIVWQKRYTGMQDIRSLQTTTGGDLVTAGTTSNSHFAVMRLDSAGIVQWSKSYGGVGGDYGFAMRSTSDGGFIVAGQTDSFGSGLADYWVLKIASDGSIDWQKTYGSTNAEMARIVQQTKDGGYLVAGNGYNGIWIIKLDASGSIVWQSTYGNAFNINISSIIEAASGGYVTVGYIIVDGVHQLWVCKLDSNGKVSWQRMYSAGLLTASYTPWGVSGSVIDAGDGGYLIATPIGMHPDTIAAALWILKIGSDGAITFNPLSGLSSIVTSITATATTASSSTTTVAPVTFSTIVTLPTMTINDYTTPFYIETPTASGTAGLPAAPSGLVLTPGITTLSFINLGWSNNATNNAGFLIYRSVNDDQHFNRVIEGWNPTNISLTDFPLTSGTRYFYKVQAFNENGYSELSSAASATAL